MTLIHVIEADSGGGKGMMMSKGRNGSPQSVIGNSAMLSCESSSWGSMDRCAAPEAEAEAGAGAGPVLILDQHPEFNSSADPLPSATDTVLSFQSAHCEASSSPNVFTEWRKRAQIDSALNPQAAALKRSDATAFEDEDRTCAVKEGPARRKDLQGIRRNAMEVGSSVVMDPQGSGNGNMERHGLWKQQGRSSPAYVLGQMNRPPPSKWDDAEKWLMNSSSEQSPAHPQSTMPTQSFAKKSPSLAVRLRHRLGASSRPTNTNTKTSQCMRSALSSQSGTMSNFSSHNAVSQHQKQQTAMDEPRLKTNTNRSEAVAIGFASGSPTVLRTDPMLPIETKIPWDERSASITAAPLPPARFAHHVAEINCSNSEEPICAVADKYADTIKTTPLHQGCAESISISSEGGSAVTELGKIRVSIRDVSTCMISPSISNMRDMATQITPFSSSKPSRCTTPVKDSPARHNTPARPSPTPDQSASLDLLQLQNCHLAKLVDFDKKSVQVAADSELLERSVSNTWSTKEEEEAESSKSLCLVDITEVRQSIIEGRAASWEEAQQAKYIASKRVYCRQEKELSKV
ncbi:hypothetical protein O6H91_06G073500 [Diphasiastrum complanatum]|uniref:Uncharacterized protein n=1 Tax=Diphasiastrum complanatum TaxID=34168 RepID=A0ACC2DFD4_DIPCM|nr:hypothetical protein O6H91_06G073500 [Diphasiastrum complanatum]